MNEEIKMTTQEKMEIEAKFFKHLESIVKEMRLQKEYTLVHYSIIKYSDRYAITFDLVISTNTTFFPQTYENKTNIMSIAYYESELVLTMVVRYPRNDKNE